MEGGEWSRRSDGLETYRPRTHLECSRPDSRIAPWANGSCASELFTASVLVETEGHAQTVCFLVGTMIGPVIRSQPSVARGEEPCVQFDTTVLTIHGHPAELLVDDGRKIARFRSEHGWGGGALVERNLRYPSAAAAGIS